jgi:hypothetical protein
MSTFKAPTQSSLIADGQRQTAEAAAFAAAQRAAADRSRGDFKPGKAPPRVTSLNNNGKA